MGFNRFAATRRLTFLAFLFSLCLLQGVARPARAQRLSGLTQTTTQTLAASSLASFVSADGVITGDDRITGDDTDSMEAPVDEQ